MEVIGDTIEIYYIDCPACGRRFASLSKKQLLYLMINHLKIHGIEFTPRDLKSMKVKIAYAKIE